MPNAPNEVVDRNYSTLLDGSQTNTTENDIPGIQASL